MSQDIFNQIELSKKPQTVFKYRSWNAGNTYDDNVLTNNELHFACPSTFEDELDCRNPTRYDLLNSHQTRQWLEVKARKHYHQLNDEQINSLVDYFQSVNQFQNSEWMAEYRSKEWKDYNALTGILCLAINPLNNSLWKKYGNNHSGICYGFDTNILLSAFNLQHSGYVRYVNDLPIIDPFDDTELSTLKRVYYKTARWQFEQEYRLRTFNREERTKVYPNNALTHIILGKKFDLSQLPYIQEAIRFKGSSIQLFRVIDDDRNILTQLSVTY